MMITKRRFPCRIFAVLSLVAVLVSAGSGNDFKETYEKMAEKAEKDYRKHIQVARYCKDARIMHFANYHYAVARRLSPRNSSLRKEQNDFLRDITRKLFFFGYYDPGVEWVEGQNTLMISKDGREKKYFRLIWLERVFYDRSDPLRLRPDWKERWAAKAKAVKEDVEMGRALGFSMGDELVWKGLPVAQLEMMCDAVRKSFPDPRVVLYYNEAWGPLLGHNMKKGKVTFRVPRSLSWFSIDLYRHGTGGDHVARMKGIYQNKIYPLLHKDQMAVLVPGCYEKKGKDWDQAKARDIRAYYRWALEDSRIVAMFPWGYGGENGFGSMKEAKQAYEEVCYKVAYGVGQAKRESR